jgi:alkaline phosphatase
MPFPRGQRPRPQRGFGPGGKSAAGGRRRAAFGTGLLRSRDRDVTLAVYLSSMRTVNRRDFLKAASTGAVLFGAPEVGRGVDSAKAGRGAARNVVVVVSDGMSLGTLSLAEQFRRRRDGRGTAWMGLYRDGRVRRALMDTASASSLVTDSAAASSAWGGGRRVRNGAINVGPGGERPVPVMRAAREAGLGTGLVTTATVTHATPAGFAVNAPARNDEADIAAAYAETGIDVILGGGARFFEAATRPDGRDLTAEFGRRGYAVVRRRDALTAAAPGKVLGLFAASHLPYTLDHASSAALTAAVPTLAEMARVALARLEAGGRGFLLQVEGARVDHAAHANDFGGLVHDQLALDDALAEVLAFAARRDDTLVVVTTDHGNANPGLNGGGNPDQAFERTFAFRQTNDWVVAGLGADSAADAVRARVAEATGVGLGDEEIALLQSAIRGQYRDAYRVRQTPVVILGQLLANHIGVGWTGIQHTSDLVELVALGPGSERVGGLMLNTDLHRVMTETLGLGGAA